MTPAHNVNERQPHAGARAVLVQGHAYLPRAHMSTVFPYFLPSMISGATYPGVPHRCAHTHRHTDNNELCGDPASCSALENTDIPE